MNFFADMHTHSNHSHDCECPMREMVEAEISRGVSVMAVTDHINIEYLNKQNVYEVARESHQEARKLSSVYKGKIKVLTGLEIGEALWDMEAAQRVICENPCDAVIGSVHAVKYRVFDYPYSLIDFSALSEKQLYEYMAQYFADYLEMVNTCDFDIAAHLNCPVRYIQGKYGLGFDIYRFEAEIDEILKKIIDRDCALEINTSNIPTLNEYMPTRQIIERYRALGGEKITTGSDAHLGENAALGFEELYRYIKEVGFDGVYYYENRSPVKIGFGDK